MTYGSPHDLTIPWQPYFDKHVFQNFDFTYFKIKQKLSSSIFLKSLDRFMLFLFVLITFEPILDGFLRFWRNPKSKMADRDCRRSDMIT